MTRLRSILRDHRGDAAIEFLAITLLIIFVFCTLITGFLYVAKYYNTAYVCRRIVREIETDGEYNESIAQSRASVLGDNTSVSVRYKATGAPISSGAKIQLLDEFTVRLETDYTINIFTVGSNAIELPMDIAVEMTGMSEVYQK